MKIILTLLLSVAVVAACFAQNYSNEIEKTAKEGDPVAQYQLAMAYAMGRNVKQSNSSAVLWMEKSASQGYKPAMNKIASFYYNLNMFDKSIEWYTKQANDGDIMAEYWLGHCYYNQNDGPSSIKWFEKAASRDDDSTWSVTASYNIGEMYAEGKVVETNFDSALKWFKKSALKIHRGAMTEIDKIYYYNLCKEESELDKRFWCRKLADDGFKSGFNGLGEMYMKEKDYERAYQMFSKAIEKKNNTAVGSLGEMYYYGYYVEKNYEKAFSLLKQSAADTDCPNANAMRLLAACYRYGLGVEKDQIQEKQWMDKAAQHKDSKAMNILGLQ